MHETRIDTIAKYLHQRLSRRSSWLVVGANALALSAGEARHTAAARKKHKKKIKRNAFGCVNVGGFCTNGGHCCSGICQGKKGKKRCRAHDSSDCQAGQRDDGCGGTNAFCTSSAGEFGVCDTTTGDGAYCAVGAGCFACAKDADCVPICGSAAACIVCLDGCEETGGTACVAPSDGACTFPPT